MTINIGNTERMIRFALGAALIALGFFGPFSFYVGIALMTVGAIAAITAAIRFCPAWAAFGVSTCGK